MTLALLSSWLRVLYTQKSLPCRDINASSYCGRHTSRLVGNKRHCDGRLDGIPHPKAHLRSRLKISSSNLSDVVIDHSATAEELVRPNEDLRGQRAVGSSNRHCYLPPCTAIRSPPVKCNLLILPCFVEHLEQSGEEQLYSTTSKNTLSGH